MITDKYEISAGKKSYPICRLKKNAWCPKILGLYKIQTFFRLLSDFPWSIETKNFLDLFHFCHKKVLSNQINFIKICYLQRKYWILHSSFTSRDLATAFACVPVSTFSWCRPNMTAMGNWDAWTCWRWNSRSAARICPSRDAAALPARDDAGTQLFGVPAESIPFVFLFYRCNEPINLVYFHGKSSNHSKHKSINDEAFSETWTCD